jgi:uncharacterized protein YdiU (UPF0061 family)
MSLKDRLRQFFSRQPTIDEDETEEEQDKELVEQFHERIETFEQSAEELFETDEEPSDEEHIEVATPEYDVGEVKIEEALLSEELEDFSQTNEIEILDVSELDDPYEHATIDGDIPQSIDFDEMNTTAT